MDSGQSFLILDEEINDGMKIWGFMSPACIEIAQGAIRCFLVMGRWNV